MSCRATYTTVKSNLIDSVILIEKVRDTVIKINEDSAMIRALVECDSLGQAHIKEIMSYKGGERLKPPKLSLKNNVLTSTAVIDSVSIYMQLKDRYKERIKIETLTTTIEVNRLTK